MNLIADKYVNICTLRVVARLLLLCTFDVTEQVLDACD